MTVTLSQIEQEAARRLGPYETHTSNGSSTATLFCADDLASSATPGDKADLFLLRRGNTASGVTLAIAASDRQRVVKLYDPDGTAGNGVAGSLLVDRAWGVAPVSGEIVELHAFDPANEIRVAAQRGLDRCFVEDRVQVALSGYAAERDLTAALPWLTRKQQLYGAYYLPTGSIYAPRPVPWFEPFDAGGHVWLGAAPDAFPFSFYVRALRPVSSIVNGLAAPPSAPVADVATGGSLTANQVYYAAVATSGGILTTPASVPVALLTAADGNNTHVARLTVVQVPGQNYYLIYLSTAAAPALVAMISEAQRAAGCTITAQSTVSATTPGAGLVDVRVAGSGSAAVQATGPQNDADALNVDLDYAASALVATLWQIQSAGVKLAALGRDEKRDNDQFTRVALQRIKPPPDRVSLNYPFGPRGLTGAGAGAIWD